MACRRAQRAARPFWLPVGLRARLLLLELAQGSRFRRPQ